MLDSRSALTNHLYQGHFGLVEAAGEDTVKLTLSEPSLGTFYQIAGWGSFEKDIQSILSNFKITGSGNFHDVQKAESISCFKIAPTRMVVRDSSGQNPVPTVINNDELVIVDLSHARTVIRLDGKYAEELLARSSGIDFSLLSFPVGGFVQTGIHHISILIERCSDHCFDLFVPTTWASSIWEIVTISSLQFGYRVEGGRK